MKELLLNNVLTTSYLQLHISKMLCDTPKYMNKFGKSEQG